MQAIHVKGKFTKGAFLQIVMPYVKNASESCRLRISIESDDSRVKTVVEEMPWYLKAR